MTAAAARSPGGRGAIERREVAGAADRDKRDAPADPLDDTAGLHLAAGGHDAKRPPGLRHGQPERLRRGRLERARGRPLRRVDRAVAEECAVAEEGHPDVLDRRCLQAARIRIALVHEDALARRNRFGIDEADKGRVGRVVEANAIVERDEVVVERDAERLLGH
eukprot:140221-Prymnesium_polylepis.1